MTSKSLTGSPCRYFDKRQGLSVKSTLPISIMELHQKLCYREPVPHLEVQRIPVLTDYITTTTSHAHNPSASLGQKDSIPYSKPQVTRLISQIPQRHFVKDRLLQQGKTQTSLHVRAIRSRANGARHRHRRICKSSLLKVAGVTFSESDSTSVPKFLNPDPEIF